MSGQVQYNKKNKLNAHKSKSCPIEIVGFLFIMEEIWKDIPEYEGMYQVSNLGNVKSLNYNRTKTQKKLKQSIDSTNYLCVCLSKNSITAKFKIHQLVSMAFFDHSYSKSKLVIDHINNIKTDNNLSNLQIISQRENCSKDRKNGTSNYVGVSFLKNKNKYQAKIYINKKNKYLGIFETEKEAKFAYNNELLKLK